MTETVYTIGHSTHEIEAFIILLQGQEIETLVDIRTVPKSRYNPQYGQQALKSSLNKHHIAYEYIKDLGGLRRARKDSPNGAWRNSSFRGYADYMQTPEFEKALDTLIAIGKKKRTVIMCAEAVPWRCHRSLVGDALLVRNITVSDIMPDGRISPHKLTSFARVEGETITYPAETLTLPGL